MADVCTRTQALLRFSQGRHEISSKLQYFTSSWTLSITDPAWLLLQLAWQDGVQEQSVNVVIGTRCTIDLCCYSYLTGFIQCVSIAGLWDSCIIDKRFESLCYFIVKSRTRSGNRSWDFEALFTWTHKCIIKLLLNSLCIIPKWIHCRHDLQKNTCERQS